MPNREVVAHGEDLATLVGEIVDQLGGLLTRFAQQDLLCNRGRKRPSRAAHARAKQQTSEGRAVWQAAISHQPCSSVIDFGNGLKQAPGRLRSNVRGERARGQRNVAESSTTIECRVALQARRANSYTQRRPQFPTSHKWISLIHGGIASILTRLISTSSSRGGLPYVLAHEPKQSLFPLSRTPSGIVRTENGPA